MRRHAPSAELLHQRARATIRAASIARARKWSAEVSEHSDALDLEQGIFEARDPKKIAISLKKSAEKSERRRAAPFRSAMSMLTFFMNRAGKNLPASRKRIPDQAKEELRKAFGKPAK
jgi:hypothetical protein